MDEEIRRELDRIIAKFDARFDYIVRGAWASAILVILGLCGVIMWFLNSLPLR